MKLLYYKNFWDCVMVNPIFSTSLVWLAQLFSYCNFCLFDIAYYWYLSPL